MKQNPFVDDVFLADEPVPSLGSVDSLHAGAFRRLFEEVPDAGERGAGGVGGAGRVVLLLAPRAGFGKSHLLARVAAEVGDRAHLVPLTFNPESPLRWVNVLDQLTRAWEVPVGATEPALPALDDLARFTFAAVSRRLIEEGKIPCARPSLAVLELRKNYQNLFDFSDGEQPVARWFGENFEKLLPLTAGALAAMAGVRPARASYWLRALCAYSQGAIDSPEAREDALRWALAEPVEGAVGGARGGMTISQAPSAGASEPEAKGKIRDLLRLAALHRPVVFVLDHLDAFFRDAEAGRTIAYMVAELQQMVPRELTILSLNEDVWESAFQGSLPSAFEDRLTSNVVNLKGLDAAEAEELIRRRLALAGVSSKEIQAFLGFLRLSEYFRSESGKLVSPRVLLRYTAIHWDVFARESAEDQHAISLASGAASLDVHATPTGASSGGTKKKGDGQDGAGFLETGPPDSAADPGESSVLGGETRTAIEAVAGDLVRGETPPESGGEAAPQTPQPEPPAEDNPFRRLKTMLTRLREERVAHGIAEPADLEEAPAEPGTNHHARQRAAADKGFRGDGSVLDQFRSAQARWEHQADLLETIDYDKLRNLIEIAGKRFPVVRYDEVTLPDHRGNPVARWAFRGNEIFIGFAAASEAAFWAALSGRVKEVSEGAAGGDGVRAKLVAFETAESRFAVPNQWKNEGIRWDVVEIDRRGMAAIFAADDLFLRAQAGEIDTHPGQILGVVASELDPLWKRLTRPIPGSASERDAA